MMKKLTIPYIAELNTSDIELVADILDDYGSGDSVSEVNWRSQFPYKPITLFRIGRSDSAIFIKFQVRGNLLKAIYTEDNDPVFKDSCVEFFCKVPENEYYANFEFNCIGTCTASKRKNRYDDVQKFSKEEMRSIKRFPSIGTKPFNEMQGSFEWELTVEIPYKLIGIDVDKLPSHILGNFYKCADDTDSPHFVSWNPIETEHPDFHRPEFFGELTF